MAGEKLTRAEMHAAGVRAAWEAMPEAAREVASESISEGVASLSTLRALPDEVTSAVKSLLGECVAIWLKPFSGRGPKLEKLARAVAQLPAEWRPYALELLAALATEE